MNVVEYMRRKIIYLNRKYCKENLFINICSNIIEFCVDKKIIIICVKFYFFFIFVWNYM